MAWQIPGDNTSPEALEGSIVAIMYDVALAAVTALSDGELWIAPVYFAAATSTRLYVLTSPTTRHALAWREDQPVAIAVYDSTQPFEMPKRGLQLTALPRRVAEHDSADAIETYGSRFPSMRSWLSRPEDFDRLESRFYEMTVTAAKVFDEPRFGTEVWLHATVTD
jgi:uncharacterized protein YhbP (UPF0306 family)